MIPVIAWDGEPISKPGLYSGIPLDIYHTQLTVGPSISSTGLRDIFHKSPRAYFRGSYLNPRRKLKKPSEAFVFGRAAHHLLLGESDFRKQFVIRPEDYNDKLRAEDVINILRCGDEWWGSKPWSGVAYVCKAWLFWQWWARKTVVTTSDIEMIRAMAEAMADEPLIDAGILNGLVEHSFVWQDKETGVWLKWRPDTIPTDSLNMADFKTCTDISDEGLERSITDWGYNQQGGLGGWACDTVIGRPMEDFTLIFVEKEDVSPCVRTKTLRPADVELGMKQNRVALRTFARCLETGKWLGPGGEQRDAEYSGLAEWSYKKIDRRMHEMERQLG